MLFTSKKPHYEILRKKWTQKHRSLQAKLFGKHKELGRQIMVGGLGGLMLIATPGAAMLSAPPHLLTSGQIDKELDTNAILAENLNKITPPQVRPLTEKEENKIGQLLSKDFGFSVSATLDGKRLNRSYGLIGGEQHLYRFPGDNLIKHADNLQEAIMYGPAGIAPGLGAWGFFESSESQFSEQDKMREKYYLAVQTFLAPGFSEHTAEYRDFFKYRKMLVVNPVTGQSVVAVIGDAGPAEWTGKHLGGSPEVMQALGLAGGPRKGPVLYFFIDDPGDKIPLGPVKAKSTDLNK